MPHKTKERIYLDYASITPLDPRVLKVMTPYLKEYFYNPSSLYKEGREARKAIDESRKKVAHVLQCKSNEVFFTGGGTEANNIALQGAYEFLKNKKAKIHMITSSIEHPSVLEIFRNFETKGVDVTYIDCDGEGIISSHQVIETLRPETSLISLMYGNNEIGTINDISKISKTVKEFRKKKNQKPIIIHTDASQGACYLNIRTDYLGVDLMTLDGSKLYGPRGSGILYQKRGTNITSTIFGGGQEEGVRSGTENTASIVGISLALSICEKEKRSESERLKKLRDHAITLLKEKIPNLFINGSETNRLPNNINFCLKGIDGEFMVIKLDLQGIACSSVTTCKNLSDDSSSYVIEAINKSCGKSSLRLSLGRYTTKQDLDYALKTITKIIYN